MPAMQTVVPRSRERPRGRIRNVGQAVGSRMRVIVDLARCQGHGRCYDLAPDVFEPDDRGHVEVAVRGDLPPVLRTDAEIAVGNCPESALRLSQSVPKTSTKAARS